MNPQGILKGLKIEEGDKGVLHYHLKMGEEDLVLNELLDKKITLLFSGEIRCSFCDKAIKKTYSNGSCYPCFISLPQNDFCILKPESCHFHKGSCRDSVWGENHCFQKHHIYLSYTSNLKVGITRGFRLKRRWLEQGALQAIKLASVENRLQAGLVEVALKEFVSDKTNWRKLLQQPEEPENFLETSLKLKESIREQFHFAQIANEEASSFNYPVLAYPKTTTPYNLEKTPVFEDRLIGLRGSYMLFERGAFNLKKFKGFHLAVKIS